MLSPDMLDEILLALKTNEIKHIYATRAEVMGYDGKKITVTGKELQNFLKNPAELGVSANLYMDMTLLKADIITAMQFVYDLAGLPHINLRP